MRQCSLSDDRYSPSLSPRPGERGPRFVARHHEANSGRHGGIQDGPLPRSIRRRAGARTEDATDNKVALHHVVLILAPLAGAPEADMTEDELAAHRGFLPDGPAPSYACARPSWSPHKCRRPSRTSVTENSPNPDEPRGDRQRKDFGGDGGQSCQRSGQTDARQQERDFFPRKGAPAGIGPPLLAQSGPVQWCSATTSGPTARRPAVSWPEYRPRGSCRAHAEATS